MGKLKKKNESGTAVTYLTRNQALKKLQVNLPDFRRLCILKGIYPHDPKYKKKITGTTAIKTFYHVKDIKHLLHEPILASFRAHKAYDKKLKKLIGKREWSTARHFEAKCKPSYRLDHVIKERYPTFMDALRDLDDALCHVFLFSTLPKINGFTETQAKECQRLVSEFQCYVIATHALRKVFLSIKGIYYQAEIHGEKITWMTPYFEFSQYVPPNVDFRVMLTFLEFYQQLLGFVNIKLLKDAGYVYPPSLDSSKEREGAGLLAVTLCKDADPTESGKDTEKVELDTFEEEPANVLGKREDSKVRQFTEARQLLEKSKCLEKIRALFSGCTFYLSREVPRDVLLFVIQAFGGKIGGLGHLLLDSQFELMNNKEKNNGLLETNSQYMNENDPRITHQIVDRPIVSSVYSGRKYVQPQWIFDCVNSLSLLKEEMYAPGKCLPPHLSPFVEEDQDESNAPSIDQTIESSTSLSVSNAERALMLQYRQELAEEMKQEEAEMSSTNRSASSTDKNQLQKTTKVSSGLSNSHDTTVLTTEEKNERKELALGLLSKKKRKLYEAMQRSNATKAAEKKRLADKRSRLEKN